ncbi:MAG: hypothetical protein E7406_01660 [Ruminococcaceae bacterium]|nr:hypothetical protein [Oscillospiraceae bacterium]
MTVARIAIKDLKTCLRIYYTYPEIGSKEIKELFGVGDNKVCNLKNLVRKVQIEKNIMVLDKHSVNTETAFEVWGIDIGDIERRVKKLEKLGLYETEEAV